MLNSKKSQSILQWYNSLTARGDVNSLAQFTDGSHFYEIVAALQPFTLHWNSEGNLSEPVIFSETSIACNEVVITSVEEEGAEEKMETSVSESGNADPFVVKESDHTETTKKYDTIRKFIDDFYHVESSSFINYGECQNGKELELAKVAIFLLTAMVQNLLSSEDKVVYNTTLLEPEVQENIRECLSLVLAENNMGEYQFKKSELHKILGRPASYKGTAIRKQPSRSNLDSNELSEGVRNVPKNRKERTSAIIYEDVHDSPLKNLLESPKIQYKTALFKKESELAKLRGALANEENKVIVLTLEKKNLNEELEKRTGSPNVPETLSAIIYADQQSSRETLERKEHDLRQDPETKDERIKRLGLQRKSDPSKNKNRNVDRLLGDVRSLEKEKSILKEKLEYYQRKFGSTTDDSPGVENLNSFKKESGSLGSATGDNGSSTSNACLKELACALTQPVVPAIVTRRSRAVAAEEEETSVLMKKKKALVRDVKVLKRNIKSFQLKSIRKEDELKMANKKLEDTNAELLKENEFLKLEISCMKEKYTNLSILLKQKDQSAKKGLIIYHRIFKLCEENKLKKLCGKKCEELQRREKELRKQSLDSEKDTNRLLNANKMLEGHLVAARHSVKELTKEKKELQFQLFIETSALSENIADRDKVVRYYLSKSKYAAPGTRRTNEEPTRPALRFTRYIEEIPENKPSTSNSVLASGSILTDDEDNIFNEILTESNNEGFPKGTYEKKRLQELPKRYQYETGLTDSDWEDDSEDSVDATSCKIRKYNSDETGRISVPVTKTQVRHKAKIIGPKKPIIPVNRPAAFVRRQATFRTPVNVQRLVSLPRKRKAH